ncbi:hypothetical protein EVAR_23601_1 [Eumeta japonica]|uniref:Uncharacterized protein n=1 Tax=Eumeta variegata TaxID=151549 RepID=A0A4C1WZN1_EUMVA|nr:hypothetical protein EVAR_23601_1 [Eumeta japonica]
MSAFPLRRARYFTVLTKRNEFFDPLAIECYGQLAANTLNFGCGERVGGEGTRGKLPKTHALAFQSISLMAKMGREITTSAAAFRSVSESAGGPLSLLNSTLPCISPLLFLLAYSPLHQICHFKRPAAHG